MDPLAVNHFLFNSFVSFTAFVMSVRLYRVQKSSWVWLLKHHQIINVLNRLQNRQSVQQVIYWPGGAFVLADGSVRIDPHNQNVALALCDSKYMNMSLVQKIECAIGCGDNFVLPAGTLSLDMIKAFYFAHVFPLPLLQP